MTGDVYEAPELRAEVVSDPYQNDQQKIDGVYILRRSGIRAELSMILLNRHPIRDI